MAKITITALGFTTPLVANTTATISYRKKGDPIWIQVPGNPWAIGINNLLIPTMVIDNLLNNTIYEVSALNSCDTTVYVEEITTPSPSCPTVEDIVMSISN